MNPQIRSERMLDDLSRFISTYYHGKLPHPLLIAQKFCLRRPDYGRKFGFSTVAKAAEYIIKQRKNKDQPDSSTI